jgi:cobalt-zinc-cadmium efflux system protein
MSGSHHGHSHASGGAHNHAGHSHGSAMTDERRIGFAFFIILIFMIVEAIGGVMAHSLALLADAGHMVSDTVALGMSWAAIRVGRRPADTARSFGYKRVEVLAAFVNGCTLFVIAGWIVFEAVQRFASPTPVLGGLMMIVAITGLVANIVAFFVLNGGNRENLNMRSAWLHILGDLLGFIVAIIAAGVILWTGWSPIDPILSVLVALLILKSAYEIVRSSSHILLEGTPPGFDLEALRRDLKSVIPADCDVHHIHVWSLTAEQPLATMHVCYPEGQDAESVVAAVKERLKAGYGITHVTIQNEPLGCNDDTH